MPSQKQAAEAAHTHCSLFEALGGGKFPLLEPFRCGSFVQRMLETLREPVCLLDRHGVLLHVNPPFAGMFRKDAGELCGHTLEGLLSGEILETELLCAEPNPDRPAGTRYEVAAHPCGEGAQEWVVTTWPLAGDSGEEVFLATLSDVTETRHNQRVLERLTYTDPLTGLSNLLRLEGRLAQALTTPVMAERGLAVMWMAIDKYALVRDSHGEEAAEQLVLLAADLLAATVRDRDLIAHVGDGRFALILFAEHEGGELTVAVDRILRTVSRPVQVAEKDLHLGLCAGVAVFPQDGIGAAELIRNAQTALHQAERHSSGTVRYYARDMNLKAMERLEMEVQLRGALLRKELLLHYQPQVSLECGRVVALEALIRWYSPVHGWVEPLRFIPLAETSGLIQPIGNWVLKTALAQLRRWMDGGMAPVRMAINVSASQLLHPRFVEMVGRSLQECGIPPELLELELTESTLMRHTDATRTVFRALKKMGVHLAIDDFGTGYSSLAYLKEFPVDRLKIDRQFLNGLSRDTRDAAIVEAIIAMAHGLGLEIVAEGVEEEHQFQFLAGSRCDIGQGYLWSRPQPAENFPACVDRFSAA